MYRRDSWSAVAGAAILIAWGAGCAAPDDYAPSDDRADDATGPVEEIEFRLAFDESITHDFDYIDDAIVSVVVDEVVPPDSVINHLSLVVNPEGGDGACDGDALCRGDHSPSFRLLGAGRATATLTNRRENHVVSGRLRVIADASELILLRGWTFGAPFTSLSRAHATWQA